MKSWKLYVLCLACVCCMAFLTGCGNSNNAKETENNVTTTEKSSEAGVPDGMNQNADGTDSEMSNNDFQNNGSETEDNANGDTDSNVNGTTDENRTDDPADTLEKAGRDLADDVDDVLKGRNY